MSDVADAQLFLGSARASRAGSLVRRIARSRKYNRGAIAMMELELEILNAAQVVAARLGGRSSFWASHQRQRELASVSISSNDLVWRMNKHVRDILA